MLVLSVYDRLKLNFCARSGMISTYTLGVPQPWSDGTRSIDRITWIVILMILSCLVHCAAIEVR